MRELCKMPRDCRSFLKAVVLVCALSAGCTPYFGGEEEKNSGEVAKLVLKLDKESYACAVHMTEESLCAASAKYPKGVNCSAGRLSQILDTGKYILKISNSSGDIIYGGSYADRPKELNVSAGTYKISVRSDVFIEPQLDKPLFGDDVNIKLKADTVACISLESKQLSGGLKLSYTSGFTNYYKGTGVYIKRDTAQVKCFYYSPHYVFFYPGEVSVIYKNKDGDPSYTPDDKKIYSDTVLLTRKLKAGEMVTIKLDYVLSKIIGTGMKISVDTARNWVTEYFNLGSIAPYGSHSIYEASKAIGDTMTVFGYVVGGDLTSSSFKKKPPFNSKTHIAIATNSWQSLREKCMGVELPASSKFRGELNLVDHPKLIGKPIVVRGTITDAYMGYPGIKSLKYYILL